MTEYTEQAVMVDALRYCTKLSNPCERCPVYRKASDNCFREIRTEAADMIEALFKQVEELKQEITEKDEEIEDLKREIMSYPDEEVEREERCAL